jgi:hypothetical protein
MYRDASTKLAVCEPREVGPSSTPVEEIASPLAHPSDRLLIQLNPEWRVVNDDLQYILQRRKGTPRSKATGWRSFSFCRTREALLRCIREFCGAIDESSLVQVWALPSWHPDQA